MDGVRRGAGRGWRWSRHLLLLVMAHGAERNSGKCLYGGASLGGGAVQECPEAPVELHTKVHSSGLGKHSGLVQQLNDCVWRTGVAGHFYIIAEGPPPRADGYGTCAGAGEGGEWSYVVSVLMVKRAEV